MLIGKRNPTTPYKHKTYYAASWRERVGEIENVMNTNDDRVSKRVGWTSDGWISVIGDESIQDENHKVTHSWRLMRKQRALGYYGVGWGGLSWAIRWDERLVPSKSMDVPRLLRHYNTWHKRTADFIISWSCPQRLFCVKGVVIMYWRETRSWENLGVKIENCADSIGASNGQKFGWKVGVVQLIQADRVGDKNGFLSPQPTRGPTLSNLFDGERYASLPPPLLPGGGWDSSEGGGSLSKVKSCNVFWVDSLKGSWQEIRGCY